MNLTEIGRFILVFAVTALADVAWTKYMIKVAEKNARSAALWSAAIVGMGSFSVLQYTANHWMAVAAVLGAYVGTYFTVKKS